MIGPCPSTCNLYLACLHNFAKEASLAVVARRGDLCDQKTKKWTFSRIENHSSKYVMLWAPLIVKYQL